MNDQLQLLIALQKIDTTILAAIRQMELLPARLGDRKAALKSAEIEYARAEKILADSADKKRDKERELSEARDRGEKLKARTSEIKKTTAYQANLAEVGRTAASIKALEAALVQILSDAESAVQEIAAQKAKIEQETSAIETVRKEIEAEVAERNEEIKRLKVERKRIVQHLDSDVNDHYTTLMRMHRGMAISEAKDAVCQGCHLHIPPQLFVEIKSGDAIETCPECRRILYYVRPDNNGTSRAFPGAAPPATG